MINHIVHFPKDFEPRPQQIDLLQRINKAYEEGYKYVICCAPTGSGKSFISKTLANSSREPSQNYIDLINNRTAFQQDMNGSFVAAGECEDEPFFGAFALTINKNLQDQYKMLFDDSSVLKGKSNYICEVDTKYQVDTAPCLFTPGLKEKCQQCNKCPYYNARNNALISKFGVLNYSMFLSLPDHVKRRQYLICDEASELEDELVKRFSRELNYKTLKKLNCSFPIPTNDYSKFYLWLLELSQNLATEINSLKSICKKNKNAPISDRQRLVAYTALAISIQTTIDTWDECEYVLEKGKDSVKITPYKVNVLSRHLFDHSERVLLLSATIIDHQHFAKTLGIKSYKYIEVDSSFDPNKAPIYVSTKVRLNYKNLNASLPYIAKQIQALCDQHQNEKGIIHTHTSAITEFLLDNLKGSRFLFRLPGTDNEKIVKQHLESSENTVLVSPSLTMGVDLKDDLARFQILTKAAYLPLGDERIKKLFENDKVWYTNKMLNNVIQACGRGVRSVDDHCVTYILDGCITDAVMANKHKLPKYFLKRFN